MDILKKQLGVILAYVILIVLLASPECAAENKTLVFVGNDSYPPISYQEGRKPKGLAIDIVHALGQRMGRQIDIRLMEWKVAQAMVAQGKADALCQLSITEARKQIYDFSDQAHDLRFSIFVRTGKQGIDDLSDLRGLQVAVVAASVPHQLAMADSQIKFTLTANDLQGFQLLKDGKVDAVLADLWTGSYVLAEKRITGIQTSGEPFAHLASAIAVKKGNSALLAAINDGLRTMQADGTIERINVKWRPKEIIIQTREQAMRKTYYVLIGILGLLLVIGAFWLITLKREISERKRVEAAIRESEERFRTIFERSTIGKSRMLPDGKLLQINQAFADMLGYTIEEIQKLNFVEITHPDDVAENRECIRILLADEQTTYRMEKRYIHKNGHLVWADVSTTLLRDEKKMPLYLITSIVDITERKKAEEELKETLESLRKAIGITVQAMVSAVESRDPYTSGHQVRSADLARAIATEMGLPMDKIEGLRMAASIHDIGKLSIPAEILSKPTKLSEIEFSLIKEHARKGYEMLKNVVSPWPLAEIVHQHHERMDGSGYPRNLKGEEICMEARILSVADVVEAMASHRPYRPGLGIDAALNEIEKNKGICYDKTVADACLKLFREKGFKLEGA